jgi:hypothetical protein
MDRREISMADERDSNPLHRTSSTARADLQRTPAQRRARRSVGSTLAAVGLIMLAAAVAALVLVFLV